MTAVPSDGELYARGARTLVASWGAYTRGARAAALHHFPGVAIAVFPTEPERAVYNNALLERGLSAAVRADALATVESAYAAAGVTDFAVWVHESDEATCDDLEERGYTLAESTRAMGMVLDHVRVPPPQIDLAAPDWLDHLAIMEVPPDFLALVDHSAFHVLIARLNGQNAGTSMAFDLGTDCGIYNVTTLEPARRRGLGTALTAIHLHDARARGCQTASLQSTEMAERMYAAVGFRDLGRIREYVPAA